MLYTPQEKKLAHEIADVLNDHHALEVHLNFAAKYQEDFLRKMLLRTMSIPEHKIRRSRAALYMSLVLKYAKDDYRN
jgi:hypothetical protein